MSRDQPSILVGHQHAELLEQGVLPRFDDYELVEEIARGGMGVVYRAKQISLNRFVAVKLVLAGQLATRESLERFHQEAEAAASLDHPGIVPIYDVGQHAGQHFFSMKLIEGANLSECHSLFALSSASGSIACRRRSQQIAELVSKIARALAFAHERGVLHRDVKPSNILIDEDGNPHLIDFGLAKLTGCEAKGLTLTSTVLGSPSYLAPEQAEGATENVTTAADVYGVGTVLYELLVGRPPFIGETALEIIRKVIDNPPERPRELDSRIAPDLETITLKCLEKDPQQRISGARELADELDRYVRGEPIVSRPVGQFELLRRWCRRNPVVAALITLVATTVVAGFLAVSWQWRRTQSANVELAVVVDRLQASQIDRLLRDGKAPQTLARIAKQIRDQPRWQTAMLGMSILQQRGFAVPASEPLDEIAAGGLTQVRFGPGGSPLVTLAADQSIRFRDGTTGALIGEPITSDTGVVGFELSPDGRRMAIESANGIAQLWHVAEGAPLGNPIDLTSPVRSIVFSADGSRWLVAGDNTVVIADAEVGEELATLRPTRTVRVVDASAEGTLVMTAGKGGVQLWDVTSGEMINTINAGDVKHADLSDDGARVATVGDERRCTIWDSRTSRRVVTIDDDGVYFRDLLFSPDGGTLVTVGSNQRARLWNTTTGAPIGKEMPHDYIIAGCEFSSEGDLLATWSLDTTARIWDGRSGAPVCEPIQHPQAVLFGQLIASKDEILFLSLTSPYINLSASSCLARVWRLHPREPVKVRSVGYDDDYLNATTLSPDGKLVASANTDQQLWLVETATGTIVNGPIDLPGDAWGLRFHPDGDRLYATTANGWVGVWSAADGRPLVDPIQLPAVIQPFELGPDGVQIALGMTNHRVQIRRSDDLRLIAEYSHGGEINALAFSPDGSLILSGASDGTAIVSETATGRLVARFDKHASEVMSVAFHPDGQRVATGSKDFSARIWDAHTGRELTRPLVHRGEVLQVEFSPNGQLLASGSRDHTVGIWKASTGRRVHPALVQEESVRNVRFSPDGKRLVALSFRGPRLWDIETGRPLSVLLPQRLQAGTGFQSTCGMPAFTPDGQAFVVGTDSPQAILWSVPVPPPVVPDWFPRFLEAVAGQRIEAGYDVFEMLPPSEFLSLRKEILASNSSEAFVQWAKRWLQ